MNTLKTIISDIKVQYGLLIVVIIAGFSMVSSMKNDINYLDVPCPVCGSDEVGNFGEDYQYHGSTKGHCFDCGTEFYVED